jgi:uncharacterized phage infection (PIP) family protein YhgE
MAGAGLDEGVGNLQRFIEGVQKTSDELGEAASTLESTASDFERLEGDAEESIGGLNGDLEEGIDQLDRAFEEAREAIDGVADAAEDIADSRLSDARESLDEAGGDCEAELSEGRAGLEEGFARLSESGYDAYATALEEAEAELGQLDDSDRDAFDGLEESASDMRGRVSEASSDTVNAVDEAEGEVKTATSNLETAFDAVTSEWKDSIDNQLQEGCEDTGAALAAEYEAWGEEAGDVAESLVEQVAEVIAEAAEFVGADSAEAMTEAAENGIAEPGADLLERLAETQETLDAGEQLATRLEEMVPDLQTCLNVMDEIDRLLNALE